MTTPNMRLLQRLAGELEWSLNRGDLGRAAQQAARLSGRLAAHFVEHESESVWPTCITTGEPVDGYRAATRETPLAVVAMKKCDEAFPCWRTPVLPWVALRETETPHTWDLSQSSTAEQRERGYRKLVCTVCGREGAEDSSG